MGASVQAVREVDKDGNPCLEGTEVMQGRQFIHWRLTRILEENERRDHMDVMMEKLSDNVQT